MKLIRFISMFLLGASAACGPGSLSALCDGGCEDTGCEDTMLCQDGGCDDGTVSDEPMDPCDVILCPSGQNCLDGRCRTIDLCFGVLCSNTGEICDPRDGACHFGAADEDGDDVTIAEGDCDDSDAEIHPGAIEICDSVDQDCDFEVDEDFPDVDNDGFDTCGFGNPDQADCNDLEQLSNPGLAEVCDGIDNDCDEDIDEGLSPRPCTTSCATGTERCEGGGWRCSAPEVCECTPAGLVDEDDCGNCGVHTRVCEPDLTWGNWSECSSEGRCAPLSEDEQSCERCGIETRTCTDSCSWSDWGDCLDQLECDSLQTQSCLTDCESDGTQECSPGCTWGQCLPPSEICNGVDDNCDGDVDEGFRAEVVRTTFTTLATYHPFCDSINPRISLACNTAIHRFCASRACTVSGFGPVEWADDEAYVICVAGANVRATSYTELSTNHEFCDVELEVFGPSCMSAAHRLCVSEGYVSGFGPFDSSGSSTHVTCVTGAQVFMTSFTVLSNFNEYCDGVVSVWGAHCHAAINRYCQDAGYTSGFGSVEWSIAEDIAYVVCGFP